MTLERSSLLTCALLVSACTGRLEMSVNQAPVCGQECATPEAPEDAGVPEPGPLDCQGAPACGAPGAERCCGPGEVCYLGACVMPGEACSQSRDCPQGSYCDPSVGRCLPRGTSSQCERRPDAGFSPTVQWAFTLPADGGDDYRHVMMSPVVVDVNRDGTPDVLANFFRASAYGSPGVLRALSGDDGRLLWSTPLPADLPDAGMTVRAGSNLAAADLDGSGRIRVVSGSGAGGLVAFDGETGALLWNAHDDAGQPARCAISSGGPAIADLDGDGEAEVICGLAVFDKDGLLRWAADGGVGLLVVVADLDGDGKPELSDGQRAFRGDGSQLPWDGGGFAGLPAVGDLLRDDGGLGLDGQPELVVVRGGKVALVSGQSGALLAELAPIPAWDGTQCAQGDGGKGHGGPPTIADFDGDGQAEIGVATYECYTVFKPALADGGAQLEVLWSNRVQDRSSSVTGSSVFDFEGDGRAEVVYADETTLHVFDGATGAKVFGSDHCSGTLYELPVIADVDGDGRANIIVAENTYAAAGRGCSPSVEPGIRVLRDANDNWVNTRRIWNQHTYHVTNVCDGEDLVCGGKGAPGNTYGAVPRVEPASWAFTNAPPGSGARPLNSYRQNVQGQGLFDASDLVPVDFSATASASGSCSEPMLLRARIINQGALGVLPGIQVSFYLEGSPRTLLGRAQTASRLLPGESELVSVLWVPEASQRFPARVLVSVDDDGAGAGAASECDEGNNLAGPFEVECLELN